MSNLSFKEWSILSDLHLLENILNEDEEFSMARGELKTAQAAITRLMAKLKGEGDLEAWVQSKITKAAEYLDTVADHLSHGEDDTKRTEDVKEAVLGRYKEDRGGVKKLRPASERVKSKSTKEDSKATGPKITKLKRREPRKGEATASQVQGWRGSDRTNTNRRGQSAPQAKVAMKEGFKGHKSVDEIAKKHNVSPSVIQKQLEMGMKVEHEHTTDNDKAMDIALQHLDEIPNYYSKLKKMEKVKEDTEILDVDGKVFARVIDIIRGSDYKFSGLNNSIGEEKKYIGKPGKKDDPCWKGYEMVGMKNKKGKQVPNCVPVKESNEVVRYCPKCEKKETENECRYGKEYWRMFSIPASLDPNPYDPNEVHPANESKDPCWSGYKQIGMKKKGGKKVPNCVPTNESISKPSSTKHSVINPGQLTTEDYQRIQSTGNVYTILFSWRGRSMMNLQLFFPNMKRPSKDEVKAQIEKLYPGAVILQWYPSPTDPSKPIVVIQN